MSIRNNGKRQKISQLDLIVSNLIGDLGTYAYRSTGLAETSALGSYAYRGSGLAELTGDEFTGTVIAPNFKLRGQTGNTGLYYNLIENRLTLANYNSGGKVLIEVNGGNYSASFNSDLSTTLYGVLGGTTAFFNNGLLVSQSNSGYPIIQVKKQAGAVFPLFQLVNEVLGKNWNIEYGRNNPEHLEFYNSGTRMTLTELGSLLINTSIDDLVHKLIVNGGIKSTFINNSGLQQSATYSVVNAGYAQYIFYKDAGLTRWNLYSYHPDETGIDNEGGNFYLRRYADDGSYLGTVMKATRKNGKVQFYNEVKVPYLVYDGGTSNQLLAADGSVVPYESGTYTPTLTNSINITSSATDGQCTYTRIGNIVTVYVKALVTPTNASSNTELIISIPISRLSASTHSRCGNGIYFQGGGTQNAVGAVHMAGTTEARFQFTCPSGAAGLQNPVIFSFQYFIS